MPASRPPLTAAQQLFHLRRSPIAVGEGDAHCGRLDWRMGLQPTPASRLYEIAIALTPETAPTVTVLRPDLVRLADGRRLPHVYRDDPVELCLFHPQYEEWDHGMRLDATIVPWAYLWFYYFEDWLITGEWAGGGEHPPSDTRILSPSLQRLRLGGRSSPSGRAREAWARR